MRRCDLLCEVCLDLFVCFCVVPLISGNRLKISVMLLLGIKVEVEIGPRR